MYAVKTNTNFKCHNCGASMSFNNFLKQVDPAVHKQYTMEKFKEGHTGRNFVTEEPEFKFEAPKFKQKIQLPKCSEDPNSEGYLTARKLDVNKFYYAEKFKKFVNGLKHTFDDTKYDEPRIIIPLYYQKTLVGIQGRSMDFGNPKSVKYITVMINDDAPKIYGLDEVQTDQTVYVTEGPSTAPSFAIRLLCAELTLMLVVGGLAILFGSMTTNHAIERLYPESSVQSTTVEG